MLDHLQDYFYTEPGRITGLGRLLVRLGGFLLLVGAFGRLATGAVNILPTLAKQPEVTKTLADIYPALPLWWVPESLAGAFGAGLILVAGICIALHGKKIDCLLRA